MKREHQSCSVANGECECPANYCGPHPRLSTCHICGEPVCKKCSEIAKVVCTNGHRYTHARVCNNCRDTYTDAEV